MGRGKTQITAVPKINTHIKFGVFLNMNNKTCYSWVNLIGGINRNITRSKVIRKDTKTDFQKEDKLIKGTKCRPDDYCSREVPTNSKTKNKKHPKITDFET